MKGNRIPFIILLAAVALLSGGITLWILGYSEVIVLVSAYTNTDAKVLAANLSKQSFFILIGYVFILAFILSTGYYLIRKTSGECLEFLKEVLFRTKEQILSSPSRERVSLLFLIALLFANGLRYLFDFPVHIDEISGIFYFIDRGPIAILTYYPGPNNHVFYYLMCWPVSLFTSDIHWIMRIPNLLILLGFVFTAFAWLRSYFSLSFSFITLVAISTHPVIVYYATHGRGYMPSIFFAWVSYWLMIEKREVNAAFYLGLFISLLGIFTIPSFALPALVLLWGRVHFRGYTRRSLRQNFRGFFLLMFSSIVLYLPILIVNGLGAITNNDWVKSAFNATSYFGYVTDWQDYIWGLKGGIFLLIFTLLTAAINFRTGTMNRIFLNLTIITSGFHLAIFLFLWFSGIKPPVRIWVFLIPFNYLWLLSGLYLLAEYLFSSDFAKKTVFLVGILLAVSGAMKTEVAVAEENKVYKPIEGAAAFLFEQNAKSFYSEDATYGTYIQWYFKQRNAHLLRIKEKENAGYWVLKNDSKMMANEIQPLVSNDDVMIVKGIE